MENVNQTICKNRSRAKKGGCNALGSMHPHDHCFLGLPQGTSFDANLPMPIGASKVPKVNKRKTMDSEGGQEIKVIKKWKRQGLCANGHTTTNKHGWYLDPNDRQTMLCSNCYMKLTARKGPCTECGRYVDPWSKSWKDQNLGAKGFICEACATPGVRKRGRPLVPP